MDRDDVIYLLAFGRSKLGVGFINVWDVFYLQTLQELSNNIHNVFPQIGVCFDLCQLIWLILDHQLK